MPTPWWVALVYGLEFAIGICNVYQFILEEACQNALLCSYVSRRHHSMGSADEAVGYVQEVVIPELRDFHDTWGYISYFSWPAFEAFITAAELGCQAHFSTKG